MQRRKDAERRRGLRCRTNPSLLLSQNDCDEEKTQNKEGYWERMGEGLGTDWENNRLDDFF